jgi:hypothetical protein
MIDRVDNLAKYRSRYIDGEQSVRSHCFIRMLEQIPKASFQLDEIERRTQDILEQLRNTPLETANQNHEIEIIPYDILWSITLNLLGKPPAKNSKAQTGAADLPGQQNIQDSTATPLPR